ncbi:g8245 [Coccomyxa viridis]|uniref:G8245 protein n=1 Tax=Coccomyxa viridis TaxID=1274662 RepID=A0ABP1FZW5_9CHLO
MASPGTDEPVRERRRLVLKPRDETAAQRAASERAATAKSNPFGAAKPRESVLANRAGKKEEDILKEEVLKEKLQLRLTPEQLDAKTALESAVEDVKQELAAENDDSKKDALTTELKEKETKLDTLMAEFEKMAVDRARSGEIGIRPSERRRQVEEAQLAAGGGGGYGAPKADGYGAPARGGFGGGGRGFAGRTGYDYGNGGARGGGRGGGGSFGAGYQPTGNYSGGGGFSGGSGQGGGYRDSYKDAGGGYEAAGQGGFSGSPSGGFEGSYGGRGGGSSRGGRGGGAGAGGLYDRFDAGSYGGGDVEYQSPYANQDRF